uniref:Uncharacterized protein n=1 Tax=Oryza barthii TaxID=65489 RepID=A0A0D3F2Q7_9ORYZ
MDDRRWHRRYRSCARSCLLGSHC